MTATKEIALTIDITRAAAPPAASDCGKLPWLPGSAVLGNRWVCETYINGVKQIPNGVRSAMRAFAEAQRKAVVHV